VMHFIFLYTHVSDSHGHDSMDIQLPVQSVPITTSVVSSNPVNGCRGVLDVSNLRKVSGFLLVL
jgi:thioredoxin-like negative regulator of GroEL